MSLGHLGTGQRHFLNGNKGLPLPPIHQVPGCIFAQTGNGHKRRQEFAVLNQEFGGMALVDVNGQELKSPDVILIHHFHGGEQIIVLVRSVFVGGNGIHVGHDGLLALGHQHRIKAALLTAAVEIGRIERQRVIDLKPGNAERHHHVCHGVRLGEQVFYLLAGANVPVGNAGINHFLLCPLRQSPALSHCLHNFEGALLRHSAGDEVNHNVVTAANGLVNGGGFGGNEILGVAQPHVGAMGEAGQPQ